MAEKVDVILPKNWITILNDVLMILKPIRQITEILSKQKACTGSMVIPVLVNLYEDYKPDETVDSSLHLLARNLKEQLWLSIGDRFFNALPNNRNKKKCNT